MPDGADTIKVRLVESLAKVAPAQWDACAVPTEGDGNPFLSHGFLRALEASGSVGRQSGWLPQYLLAEDAAGGLAGALPMYLKSHSQGEYVFDHGWAAAFERAGGAYYPKLQVAVPFTPVPGRRLLVKPGPQAGPVADALVRTAIDAAKRNDISSLHVTFCSAEESQRMEKLGLLRRLGHQYHWHNPGYGSFGEFLDALSSRKRKAIRKEREKVQHGGLLLHRLCGADIKQRHWDAFFAFYMDTGSRKWGSPYLTREFFDLIGQTMADKIVLVIAEHDGTLVAGALNLAGREALYGRNWGCGEDYKFLHFEACYYQAIEHAIEHKLARVEAGAQGEHKIQRGYLPVPTYSAHWIGNASFRKAVADYLARERPAVEQEIDHLAQFSPFKRAGEKD